MPVNNLASIRVIQSQYKKGSDPFILVQLSSKQNLGVESGSKCALTSAFAALYTLFHSSPQSSAIPPSKNKSVPFSRSPFPDNARDGIIRAFLE